MAEGIKKALKNPIPSECLAEGVKAFTEDEVFSQYEKVFGSVKKIAIITPFLANGGLERVAIVGAEELSRYFDVTLIVMDSFHIDYPYNGKMIDLEVSLMDRGVLKRLYNIVSSTLKLWKLKKEHDFDIVISHGELANLPNVFSGGENNILAVHENRFAGTQRYTG